MNMKDVAILKYKRAGANDTLVVIKLQVRGIWKEVCVLFLNILLNSLARSLFPSKILSFDFKMHANERIIFLPLSENLSSDWSLRPVLFRALEAEGEYYFTELNWALVLEEYINNNILNICEILSLVCIFSLVNLN